ncbi:hypothetical protein HYPSUDRAFT_895339 [Hypholoma sublateritium FD-334 SS-4]|uniref:Uncharacterized protein n=1 Tax=Hypholoma sublateritium (strain FD-334 SS-4) TaxID=945553 RepID=A0A0D2M7U4_HYPSF|nr:hypothetical protein HYPSUDRAFT_895276 [Hypholoma sublateritium FD-334 SS-4]KJA19318.1 hypothetical protein HYPSUDRAFT_895339 [Hypholoma sublateritium FD-334 SS-4]
MFDPHNRRPVFPSRALLKSALAPRGSRHRFISPAEDTPRGMSLGAPCCAAGWAYDWSLWRCRPRAFGTNILMSAVSRPPSSASPGRRAHGVPRFRAVCSLESTVLRFRQAPLPRRKSARAAPGHILTATSALGSSGLAYSAANVRIRGRKVSVASVPFCSSDFLYSRSSRLAIDRFGR